MVIKIKKINGEEFTAEVNQNISDIYKELTNNLDSSFILLGERIEQKVAIESIFEEVGD
ncbi:phosphoribosyl-ATP diphosphatase [Enterococcus hirae]|nr:phosphoribosyl-ATP diphosphatase [Enterococcus hirae]